MLIVLACSSFLECSTNLTITNQTSSGQKDVIKNQTNPNKLFQQNFNCDEWRQLQPENRTDDYSCGNHAEDCGNIESCMAYYRGKDKDQTCHCTYPKSISLSQLIAPDETA